MRGDCHPEPREGSPFGDSATVRFFATLRMTAKAHGDGSGGEEIDKGFPGM